MLTNPGFVFLLKDMARWVSRVSRFAARFLLLSAIGCTVSHAADLVEGKCVALPAKLVIDQAWGGARVGFDSLEDRDFLYIAYYDADRWLTVAQVNKCTGKQEKVRVPSQFGGWDEHNSISLVLDGENRLHVSGNMHVSPLVYARMDSAVDFHCESFARTA